MIEEEEHEEHEHEQQASINSGLEIWVPHYLILQIILPGCRVSLSKTAI